MLEKKGAISFEYVNRIVNVRYSFWMLVEAGASYPGVDIYDKDGRAYRFSRQEHLKQWTSMQRGTRWPLEFRKKLAQELEKINNEMVEQIKGYKKPSYSYG